MKNYFLEDYTVNKSNKDIFLEDFYTESFVLNEGIYFNAKDVKRNLDASKKAYDKLIAKYKNDKEKCTQLYNKFDKKYNTLDKYYKNQQYTKILLNMRQSLAPVLKLLGITAASVGAVLTVTHLAGKNRKKYGNEISNELNKQNTLKSEIKTHERKQMDLSYQDIDLNAKQIENNNEYSQYSQERSKVRNQLLHVQSEKLITDQVIENLKGLIPEKDKELKRLNGLVREYDNKFNELGREMTRKQYSASSSLAHLIKDNKKDLKEKITNSANNDKNKESMEKELGILNRMLELGSEGPLEEEWEKAEKIFKNEYLKLGKTDNDKFEEVFSMYPRMNSELNKLRKSYQEKCRQCHNERGDIMKEIDNMYDSIDKNSDYKNDLNKQQGPLEDKLKELTKLINDNRTEDKRINSERAERKVKLDEYSKLIKDCERKIELSNKHIKELKETANKINNIYKIATAILVILIGLIPVIIVAKNKLSKEMKVEVPKYSAEYIKLVKQTRDKFKQLSK